MAKTANTFVIALFFLVSLSEARLPSDFPLIGFNARDLPKSLHESESESETETEPVLLLPSEKQRSEPSFVVESEISESETANPKTLTAEILPETVNSIPVTRPLTIVTFRPVNRRFHLKRSYPFRFSRRRGCGHNRRIDPITGRRFGQREVSYGDDMILSSEKNDFDPLVYHGRVRQIPARVIRSHHHHHHHHHHHSLKQNLKRWFHQEQNQESEKREKEHEERSDGGFLKRFRKFLNQF